MNFNTILNKVILFIPLSFIIIGCGGDGEERVDVKFSYPELQSMMSGDAMNSRATTIDDPSNGYNQGVAYLVQTDEVPLLHFLDTNEEFFSSILEEIPIDLSNNEININIDKNLKYVIFGHLYNSKINPDGVTTSNIHSLGPTYHILSKAFSYQDLEINPILTTDQRDNSINVRDFSNVEIDSFTFYRADKTGYDVGDFYIYAVSGPRVSPNKDQIYFVVEAEEELDLIQYNYEYKANAASFKYSFGDITYNFEVDAVSYFKNDHAQGYIVVLADLDHPLFGIVTLVTYVYSKNREPFL